MKRFSLKTLLILITAVAVFAGYSQYRRRKILRMCEQLQEWGAIIDIPSDYSDYLWQRRPKTASLHISAGPTRSESAYPVVDQPRMPAIHILLHKCGIEDIQYFFDHGGTNTEPIKGKLEKQMRDVYTRGLKP